MTDYLRTCGGHEMTVHAPRPGELDPAALEAVSGEDREAFAGLAVKILWSAPSTDRALQGWTGGGIWAGAGGDER